MHNIINPRRTCTSSYSSLSVCLCVCLSVCLSGSHFIAIGFTKSTTKYSIHIVNMSHPVDVYMYFRLSTYHVCAIRICMKQLRKTVKFLHTYVVLAPCILVLHIVYVHVLCMYVCMYV